MSFDSMLDDTCNIYFVKTKTTQGGYGIPPKEEKYYSETPDLENIPCHFCKIIRYATQEEPQNVINYDRKLILPYGTLIKPMDKIIHLETGEVYTTSISDDIRGHHVAVGVKRENRYL